MPRRSISVDRDDQGHDQRAEGPLADMDDGGELTPWETFTNPPAWEEVGFRRVRGFQPRKELPRAGHTTTVVGSSLIVMFGFRKMGNGRDKTYLSDVLQFNTDSYDWVKIGELGAGRGHHTATLVGSRIWVIGGQDSQYIFDGVLCFDIRTRKWVDLQKEREGGFHIEWPRTRDGKSLARRTCHTAMLHPHNNKAILVCGGISLSSSGEFMCRNDVFSLDTISGYVQPLINLDCGGVSFHSAATLMSSILIIGGDKASWHGALRGAAAESGSGRKSVLDVLTPVGDDWETSSAQVCAGRDLLKISSQSAVVYQGMVFCYGGLRGRKKPNNDLLCLRANADGDWSCSKVPTLLNSTMEGHAAHTLSVVGGQLYVVGGCTGSQRFSGKVWKLDLRALIRRSASMSANIRPDTPPLPPPGPAPQTPPCPLDGELFDSANINMGKAPPLNTRELRRAREKRTRTMGSAELHSMPSGEVPRSQTLGWGELHNFSNAEVQRARAPGSNDVVSVHSGDLLRTRTAGSNEVHSIHSVHSVHSVHSGEVPCQPAGIPPFHYRSPLFPFSATDDDVSRPPIDPAKKKKLSSMPVSQSPWPDAPDAPDAESFPNYFQQPPVPGPRGMNATVSYSNPLYPFMTPEEELASLQEDPVRKMKLASVPVASVPWPDMPPAADPRGSATNAQLTIAQQEIEELRAKLEAVTSENESLKSKLEDAGTDCSKHVEKAKELQKEIDDLKSINQELQDKIEEHVTTLSNKSKRIKELEVEIVHGEELQIKSNSKLRDLQGTIVDLEEEVKRLIENEGAGEEAAKDLVEELESRIEELEGRIMEKHEEMAKHSNEAEWAMGEWQRCKNQLDDTNGACETLKEQLKDSKEQLKESKEEAKRLKGAKEGLQKKLAELGKKNEKVGKDHDKTVKEWEEHCAKLREDLDAQLNQIRESKEQIVTRLRQQLHHKEAVMQRMQEEFDIKLAAKAQALVDAHNTSTSERDSLLQERQAARIQLAEERSARATEVDSLRVEMNKLQEELNESRSKAEELQAQRIARSETLGEAVRVRRKEMKELAEKFACAVAEIDEKFSKSSGLSYGSS